MLKHLYTKVVAFESFSVDSRISTRSLESVASRSLSAARIAFSSSVRDLMRNSFPLASWRMITSCNVNDPQISS